MIINIFRRLRQYQIEDIMTTNTNENSLQSGRRRPSWQPINSLKNSRLTIQIHCADSGKRINVPAMPIQSAGNLQNYFDEAPADHIIGSTTLQELIKRVKKDIPSLYLWDEVGGATLSCGPNTVHQGDWDTTMICELIWEDDNQSSLKEKITRVKLDDGREAVVFTIGTPAVQHVVRRSVIDRCLSSKWYHILCVVVALFNACSLTCLLLFFFL